MPIPKDYRTVKNPKLLSRDILIWISDNSPEEVVSSKIAEEFNILQAEACTRLALLRRYGCLKIRSKKVRPYVYYITRWGRECAERWRKTVTEKKKSEN